jgi:hypothetical protein
MHRRRCGCQWLVNMMLYSLSEPYVTNIVIMRDGQASENCESYNSSLPLVCRGQSQPFLLIRKQARWTLLMHFADTHPPPAYQNCVKPDRSACILLDRTRGFSSSRQSCRSYHKAGDESSLVVSYHQREQAADPYHRAWLGTFRANVPSALVTSTSLVHENLVVRE